MKRCVVFGRDLVMWWGCLAFEMIWRALYGVLGGPRIPLLYGCFDWVVLLVAWMIGR
jgi:hypothetical protein